MLPVPCYSSFIFLKTGTYRHSVTSMTAIITQIMPFTSHNGRTGNRNSISIPAKSVAVLKSANMSIGVNLLLDLVQRAAQILYDANFDIEVVEKHHNQKIDAPSGTAMALADAINTAMDEKFHYVYDRSQKREKRERTEIGIHAIRGGNIVGEHDVIFAGRDEVITLSHHASSREVFAVGAVKAAKFLAEQPAGLYSMKEVLA